MERLSAIKSVEPFMAAIGKCSSFSKIVLHNALAPQSIGAGDTATTLNPRGAKKQQNRAIAKN
jgi:hypothetical protein